MVVQRFLLVLTLLLAQSPAISHGLRPSRLEAPAGSRLVAYRFTAINNYSEWEQYAVQCFKGNLNTPYDCKSYPQVFNIAPKKSRTFKTQIAPDEDGIYLVCTIQTKEANIVTRVCATFGVGVSADSDRVSKSTKHPSIPSRPRQGSGS